MLIRSNSFGKILVFMISAPVVVYAQQPINASDVALPKKDNDLKISYFVPDGFTQAEMDADLRLLSTINGEAMPAPIRWSIEKNQFEFDKAVFRSNGVSEDSIELLDSVLQKIDYAKCAIGCEETIGDWQVVVNKSNQTLTLMNTKLRFLRPKTTFGLVHNQSLEYRDSDNGYKSFFAQGNGYIGLPERTFGYFNWYQNNTKSGGRSSSSGDISTAYLQKNFDQYYLRAGKHDALDYSSNSVSTSINQAYKEFVTIGSQSNLDNTRDDTKKLTLFSKGEGNYEFWSNGKRIYSQPATIGLNQVDMNRLPGGFYTVEIRLVDANGRVIDTEMRQIANLNYNQRSGWYATVGNALFDNRGHLLSVGANFSNDWFYGSSALVYSTENMHALETNVSRPFKYKNTDFSPTFGLLAGEEGATSYMRVGVNNARFGMLNISHFEGADVSELYRSSGSTSLSYSRAFGKVTGSYFFNKFNEFETHQLQASWGTKVAGVLSQFNVGLQKGGYNTFDKNEIGVFANATFYLDRRTNASMNMSYQNSQLNTSASYYKDFQDGLGKTTLGADVNKSGSNDFGFNAYAKRVGTRGEVTGRIGQVDSQNNYSVSYNGMLAVNKDGVALGRTSSNGVALMVQTPDLGVDAKYSFMVGDSPVKSGGNFAVPINSYNDISFVKVQNIDKKYDMNIQIPANIVRSHPGQVYPVKAEVELHMLYNGFLEDAQGNPVSGDIVLNDIREKAYANGLFSIASNKVLNGIKVVSEQGTYNCDLTKESTSHRYLCKPE